MLVNEGFGFDARSAASGRGMPGVRVVPETVPCECTVPERITNGVRAAIDDVVLALTTPLTGEERSPSPREHDGATGVVFKGDLREVQQFFYRRGWTDGLPIVPPSPDAVQEMLAGTDPLAGTGAMLDGSDDELIRFGDSPDSILLVVAGAPNAGVSTVIPTVRPMFHSKEVGATLASPSFGRTTRQ